MHNSHRLTKQDGIEKEVKPIHHSLSKINEKQSPESEWFKHS